jgi:hypothetical protein
MTTNPSPLSVLPGKKRTQWRLAVIFYAAVALLIAAGILLNHQRKDAEKMATLWNMQFISHALFDFDRKYGRFPDASTAARVKADTGTVLTLGSGSSNQLFRQLIVTGLNSEKPFYGAVPGYKKCDSIFDNDARALAPGECAFGYIAGQLSSSPGAAPLIVIPLIPGTTMFDRKACDGEAMILHVDGTVSTLPVDASGHAILNGMDLFDPRQPFWDGKAPDLKWQE